MSDRSAKSAPAPGVSEEVQRHLWLSEMKAKNDVAPGMEHWVGNQSALACAYFWSDLGHVAMRRGPERHDDPMNWLVRIRSQGILYLEAVERERLAAEQARAAAAEAERAQIEAEADADFAAAVEAAQLELPPPTKTPIGFKP